ncbi:unnamed protein product [Calypogeia fissa]
MTSFRDTMKLSLGLCLGIVVVLHGTQLALELNKKRKSTLPPGPRPWPIFGNTLQLGPSPTKMLAKVCEEYGGIMTLFIGPNPTIVISSPKLMARLIGPLLTADHFESRPEELMHGGAVSLATNGYCKYINEPTHRCPEWRKVRRILSSYLMGNKGRFADFQPVQETHRDKVLAALVENLKAKAVETKCYVVSMRPHLRYGCLDLLYTMCFGSMVDVHTGLVDKHLTLLHSAFRDVVRLGTICKFTDYLPIVREMPTTVADIELAQSAKRAEECSVETVGVVRSRFDLKDRPRRSKLWHSFLDVLANLKGDEKLSDREITWILSEIMLSAVDQTAATVEWALGHLIYHHDMQLMIQAEIDRVVGPQKHISDDDIDKMPYLKAVVKETQRVNHPLLLTLPHVITKPFQLGGYRLPKGTHMVAIIPALLKDPNLWIEPEDFRPERFFHDSHEGVVDQAKHQLRVDVFNAVNRFCPGQGLVTHKARLFLAKILQSFDVLAAHTGKPRPYDDTSAHESGIINMLKSPLQASLRPRGEVMKHMHT